MDSCGVDEKMDAAHPLENLGDEGPNRVPIPDINPLREHFDFELLQLELQIGGLGGYRTARKIDPVEGHVHSAAGKLDGAPATYTGRPPADDRRASPQASQVTGGLGLGLLADLLEQCLDEPTRPR